MLRTMLLVRRWSQFEYCAPVIQFWIHHQACACRVQLGATAPTPHHDAYTTCLSAPFHGAVVILKQDLSAYGWHAMGYSCGTYSYNVRVAGYPAGENSWALVEATITHQTYAPAQ